jgi:outer membrane protein assembly factor BamB
MSWNFTVSKGKMTAPLVQDIDGELMVFVGTWLNDQRMLNNRQEGLLYGIKAGTGEIAWKSLISNSAIHDFSFMEIKSGPALFVPSSDGRLTAVNCRDGSTLWRYIGGKEIYSPSCAAEIRDQKRIFLGTRFGTLVCLDAETGKKVWSFKSGWWIDSGPAFCHVQGRPMVFFGSYDRSIYGMDAETGKLAWFHATGNGIYSSPAVANVSGRQGVFIASWDNHLYLCDALSGKLLWKHFTGEFTWSYMERGDSHWSSPSIGSVNGEAMLFFGSYDGHLYAFKCTHTKDKITVVEESSSTGFSWIAIIVFSLCILGLAFLVIKLQKK